MGPLDTQYSVASLRPMCQVYSDPGSGSVFTPQAAPSFIPYLTEACDRLNDDGLWKGVKGEVVYNGSPNGYITLPRRYLDIEGATYGNAPVNMFSTFNQFKDLGLGWRSPKNYTLLGFTDMQDGWCTQLDIDPDTATTLQVVISNPVDAGKTIRLYGTDPVTGKPIYQTASGPFQGAEGFPITTSFPSATTSQQFTSIDRISADLFIFPWTLWANLPNATGGGTTLTQIGYYEPGEQNPQYRRYKTGVVTPQANPRTNECSVLRVLCKRRIIPLIYETDLVFPGAPYALSLALQALRYEKVIGDVSKAVAYWNDGVDVLNKKIKSARGRQNLTVPFRLGYPSMPEQTF